MRLTIITITLALAGLTFSGAASASDAPSFDSDCVGTQWVIRNRGLEPFNIGTPTGDIYMAVDAVWAPPANLDSVIISDTVIIRGSCEVFAPAPTPARLPATGSSPILALLALALTATGAVALRVSRTPRS